ncbi:uncharacterized protein B0I36DRAFT_406849 [Microdochium trichocladiopsis]|uniref:Uncharacterized protein n=1 Tax=Microdochium trichocladiopsis TaxID=1682393 RepID=A0A9P9BRL8_9PEZI|nr:uncharacterized protein B0I36DRAFT_406849 [Microdochium trichocladiopsis]KAH7036013.1 hypothetical protein B0I36DRAFT_406849 [Microdochium trichocladiopsis]
MVIAQDTRGQHQTTAKHFAQTSHWTILATARLLFQSGLITATTPTHTQQAHALRATQIEAALTGNVPVHASRLNIPYPGSWDTEELSRPWTLELNVTHNGTPDRKTEVILEVRPPPAPGPGALYDEDGESNVPREVSGTWKVMYLLPQPVDLRQVPGDNDMEDGSCPTSVLSEQCVRDMRELISIDPKDFERTWENFTVPESCGGYTKPERYYTSTPKLRFSLGGPNSYNTFGLRTWPLISVWGKDWKPDNDGPVLVPAENILFSCVKAAVAMDNSTLPTGGTLGLPYVTSTWAPGPATPTAATPTPTSAGMKLNLGLAWSIGITSAILGLAGSI